MGKKRSSVSKTAKNNSADGEDLHQSADATDETPAKKGKATAADGAADGNEAGGSSTPASDSKPKKGKASNDVPLTFVRSFAIRQAEEEVETGNSFYSDALSLAITENDDIIISDAGKMRLQVFSDSGILKTEVLGADLPDCYPACVCSIPQRQEIVVSHCFAYHGLVLKANEDYTKVAFSSTFRMDGSRCWGIAYSAAQDQLVVAHEQYKKVSRIDPKTWQPFSQFVTDGAPFYIALSGDGSQLFITTSDENRVEAYDIFGKYLGHYGSMGSRVGQFVGIAGLCVDPEGNLIVCDKGNHRIQMLTKERKWKALKVENKAELRSPTDVKINGKGELCVLANNHVFVYKMLQEGMP